MTLTFLTRLWLAVRVLRGRVTDFSADAITTRVTFDFTQRERVELARRTRPR